MQITSDIELSGAGCTTAITPNQLVQSSSENDNRATGSGLIEQLRHMVQMLVDPFGQFFDGLLLELVTFPELDVQGPGHWLRFRPIAQAAGTIPVRCSLLHQ
uniref:hypothetical protein n=1 Tax=Enterobacter hormaechei TaxID=158836 RepID=UPI0038902E23